MPSRAVPRRGGRSPVRRGAKDEPEFSCGVVGQAVTFPQPLWTSIHSLRRKELSYSVLDGERVMRANNRSERRRCDLRRVPEITTATPIAGSSCGGQSQSNSDPQGNPSPL
jgi:hypothetical protein